MLLKILSHPIFANLNLHLPMMADLSYPLAYQVENRDRGFGPWE